MFPVVSFRGLQQGHRLFNGVLNTDVAGDQGLMAQGNIEETTNYYRLISLVVKIGSEALRDVLLFKTQPDPLSAVLQRNMNVLNGLLQRHVLFQDQYNLLTKPVPDADDFDISLLYAIFRNNICPNVVPPLHGWNAQNLNVNDFSLGAELLRMTGIRNKIAHRPTTQVETQEFENTWNELERIIIRIARHGSLNKAQYLKTKIDELKIRQLDASRKEYLESFWIWQTQEIVQHSAMLNQIHIQNDRMLNIGEESKAKAEESFEKLMQEVLEVKTTLSVIKQNPPEKSSGQAHVEDRDNPEDELHQNQDDHDFNAEYEDEPLYIVTRAEWNGRPAKQFDYMITPVSLVFIHHTAWREINTPEDCSKEMRHLQDHHMDTNGWDDIGYNFVIGGDGRVYEGRGWDRVGAHTKGWNSISVSFAVMGNYHDHLPDSKVLRAIRRLMDLGVTLKKLTGDYKLYGHCDASRTLGPGEKFYNEIRGWKRYGPGPPKKVSTI